jgi:hypothetical protein
LITNFLLTTGTASCTNKGENNQKKRQNGVVTSKVESNLREAISSEKGTKAFFTFEALCGVSTPIKEQCNNCSVTSTCCTVHAFCRISLAADRC